MDDTPSPFGHFNPNPPAPFNPTPTPPAEPPKKAGGKKKSAPKKAAPTKRTRGPRRQPLATPNATAVPAVNNDPKMPARRKKTAARKSRQKVRAMRVDVTKLVPAMVGLKEHESQALLALSETLQGLNKSGRRKVIDALARIYA